MRATRAFVGAFGAGISLAIAGSTALLLVSSVIAFKGWPDDLSGTSAPEVARLAASPPASAARISAPKVSLPHAQRASALAAAARHDRTLSAAVRGPGRVGPTATTAPSGTVPGSAATADAPAPAPSTGGGSSPVSGATHQVSGTVTDATSAVADAVAPVSPTLSGALQSVGAAGAQTVDQVGDTVGGVVSGVLP